jgi:hypothetical protein
VSASKYRKSESRDVRPFFEAATLDECLRDTRIRLFEGHDFVPGTSFSIDEQDVPRLAPTLDLRVTEAALSSAPVSRSDLVLAVTAVNPFLKRTCLVRRVRLDEEIPKEIAVGGDVLGQLGGGSHLTIEIALCLATNLAKAPGRPFMQGHWLSRRTFDLRPPKPTDDFDVEATDDDGWTALGLPAKTLYHVEYYAGFNEPATKAQPLAKVRIHSDVHRRLATDTLSKMSRPMMAFLAAEIPCQLLAASLPEWKDAETPQPRSPLDAFLRRLRRLKPGCTLGMLRTWVETPGMPHLRAMLHADQESVRKVVEA